MLAFNKPRFFFPYFASFVIWSHITMVAVSQAIHLHPDNPHYFSYKGAPKVLISSAEHYGAVLNVDFDFKTYLETLHAEGMDYTRIFTGVYVENAESFGIEKNTLAPLRDKLIAPWARSDRPGYVNGGNKFDLDTWNPDYFSRLHAFVALAQKLDIIVELTFFSSIYRDDYWAYCPFFSENNINETDRVERVFVHTLRNGNLFSYQEKMVRKITRELNSYDNVIFEIQNEPWADQGGKIDLQNKNVVPKEEPKWYHKSDLATELSLAWQTAIAEIIRDEEAKLPNKHLIAQNYCNFRQAIAHVDDNIDIMNFHYAWPEAVHLNYGYELPISFDESGFAIKSETSYRTQAWRFMLAGGSVFNNLDYSFVAGHEDGSFERNSSPGLGSKSLRRQFKFLKDFMYRCDFINMQPANHFIRHVPGFVYQGLAKEGASYAYYFEGEGTCKLKLEAPNGLYTFEWWSPKTSNMLDAGEIKAKNGEIELIGPKVTEDIALKLTKK